MVCAALTWSGLTGPAHKNTSAINAIVSGGRPFFAVIQGADGIKLPSRMLAPLPGSGAL
jgi:hypothetical protein